MKSPDLVLVGRVVRGEGARGELKIRLPAADALKPAPARLFVESASGFEAYEVERLRADRNAHVLKLRGVDSVAAAEALRGRRLYAAEEDFRPPAEGAVYQFQVIGSAVVTRDGRRIGTVTGVLTVGRGEVLVVAREAGEAFVPFSRRICVAVDAKRREIVIDPPEGLLELNEI